jgi:KaiC/GvpD/RAD55 family RecA-like ATPase
MMSGKRVPTGVPELDVLIEGGLREGKTYLVLGQPGTGKSILCLQFLVRGLMEKEKCLYVAIDEKPADVIDQATSLGWDLAPFIESKEFLILDASAYFGARAVDAAKGVDVQRVTADLNAYIARMGATRVVIDPVGPLLASRNADQPRQLIYALQANTSTTNLLTTYSADKQLRGVRSISSPVRSFSTWSSSMAATSGNLQSKKCAALRCNPHSIRSASLPTEESCFKLHHELTN